MTLHRQATKVRAMREPFTPGPWGIEHMRSHQLKIAGPLLDRGGRTRRIAEIGSPRAYENPELDAENEANARLIAAAPDLYAACEAARQFIENGVDLGFIRMPDPETPDKAHKTLPAIIAALAKATGDA